ncbi:hypothetical protein PVAP13_7NG284400 [Panicum virgatum]|uniref:Uncharacterized protein n=1 Tax=Panicum virgatum TaxID=38727 RepID=A0A8T0Q2A8_PANVG|nr:hypothetical protein PVAP13_7NG284400 [Panicum virgatum]
MLEKEKERSLSEKCVCFAGHHAVDSEASFTCAHVEGRQGSLRHRCALLLPPGHRWLLGLRKPDPSERHPERPVQVPQPRCVPAGAGDHHAAGDHQLPDHVPDLRHARVRQHGGRVRAPEEPSVPPVAALGLPRLLRRRQLPHRRRAAVPVGARRRPGRDRASRHAGVPVLHVGGHQEAAQGHGDVERQLGSGHPRDEHKLCAHSREPLGSRGERLACQVLQACGCPVNACKIVKNSGSRFLMKYDVWCCVP